MARSSRLWRRSLPLRPLEFTSARTRARAVPPQTPARRFPPARARWELRGDIMRIRYIWLLAAPLCIQAQQATLGGPVAGYVFDPAARVVRPVQGVPGASVLGDPVNFGSDVAAAFVSP